MLRFLHAGCVPHCRIKASISTGGERKYHLLDSVKRDTLYELISFYTHNALDTPNFKTFLQTPCPQPHLDKPWFSASADTEQAEKLLNAVPMDGAFMVRYSTTDKTVFVVSLRIDNNLCHFRLKREGRLFMVSQRTFETLCHFVDFYASTPFVRGVSLKFPVNEQTISQYTDQNGGQLQLDGFYIDLNNLDKEDIHYLGSELIQSGAILLRLTQASAAISPFGTLKKVLAKCTGLQVSSLRLLLDGRRVSDDDTSQSLEMCVGDVIEVYSKRLRDINISKDQMLDVRKDVGEPLTD